MASFLDSRFVPSENIVAREIEGELIIVPLISGIGDLDDELFTLNESGKAIWRMLDGKNSLQMVIDSLTEVYDCDIETIIEDVSGLVEELENRGILVAL